MLNSIEWASIWKKIAIFKFALKTRLWDAEGGICKKVFETTVYNDTSAEEFDSESNGSDEIQDAFKERQDSCGNIKCHTELIKYQNSEHSLMDGDEAKVCTSETSTAETLKCTSSIDPWNNDDDLEEKDTEYNELGWGYTCLYFCDICF